MNQTNDRLAVIEAALEKTARQCLRLTADPRLSPKQHWAMAKWIFGCLNQRFTLRSRVAKRGMGEVTKVMKFIDRAFNAVLKITQDLEIDDRESQTLEGDNEVET